MKKKTVLILGVSSFVGSSLAEFFKNDFRVIGTYYKTKVDIEGVLCIPLDVHTKEGIQLLIYSFRPDVTIYCIGLTSIQDCHEDERGADKLNSVGVFNVSTYTERFKSKLCYISSSYIFSGENRTYGENDTPDPLTLYGRSKASAEFYIQKSCLNYLIFRCCPLYGRSINPRSSSFLELLEKKVFYSENFTCDGKILLGHLDVYYLAMLLKMAIKKNVTNRLFQVSTKDVFSYYDFAKMYCKIFGLNSSAVAKGAWHFPEEKGLDTHKDSSGIKKFQMSVANLESYFRIQMPTIEESIRFALYRFGGGANASGKDQNNATIQFI